MLVDIDEDDDEDLDQWDFDDFQKWYVQVRYFLIRLDVFRLSVLA